MDKIMLPEESYQIVGICMEVHSELGPGFREEVYKDAVEIEFHRKNIIYQRERQFKIEYKGHALKRSYFTDFLVFDKIILEIKAATMMSDQFIAQTLSYVKASGLELGILVNFGQKSLTYKRILV